MRTLDLVMRVSQWLVVRQPVVSSQAAACRKTTPDSDEEPSDDND